MEINEDFCVQNLNTEPQQDFRVPNINTELQQDLAHLEKVPWRSRSSASLLVGYVIPNSLTWVYLSVTQLSCNTD